MSLRDQQLGISLHVLTLYNRAWITLSSSVILFNKWILDTLNFRKSIAYASVPSTVLTR